MDSTSVSVSDFYGSIGTGSPSWGGLQVRGFKPLLDYEDLTPIEYKDINPQIDEFNEQGQLAGGVPLIMNRQQKAIGVTHLTFFGLACSCLTFFLVAFLTSKLTGVTPLMSGEAIVAGLIVSFLATIITGIDTYDWGTNI